MRKKEQTKKWRSDLVLMAVIGQRECRGQKIADDVLFCVSPVIFHQESAGLGVDCGRVDQCDLL